MQSIRRMLDSRRTAALAKETLINTMAWSTEYMVTHFSLIVANPLLYRAITKFTESYLLSPLALIGRGSVWIGRGLYVVAVPEARPENVEQVFTRASVELLTMLAVEAVYITGSKLSGHPNLLVEKTYLDTFVVSAVSALVLEMAEHTPPVRLPFWNRRQEEVAAPEPVHEGSRLLMGGNSQS